MKTIKLKKIKLQDWKSLSFEIEFNNNATHISGRCGVGKSSIMHAWYWLWTGYANPYTQKNANLYDNKKEITPNTPEASVTAIFTINDIEYSLQRKAKPSFTKDKSNNTYVKKPTDKYTILLDDIEIQSSKFTEWVNENICSYDLLPYCLDGAFFTTLCRNDKDKARQVLMSIVGNITEDDFTKDYSSIYNKEKKYTPQDVKKQAKNKIKEYDDQFTRIPVMIEMQEKNLLEYDQDFSDIEGKINKLKKEISDLDESILGNNEAYTEYLKKIENKRLSQSEGRVIYLEGRNAVKTKINAKIRTILNDNAIIAEENRKKTEEREYLSKRLELEKNNLSKIEQEFLELNKKVIENKSRIFTSDKCAYCGQELPVDMLEDAKKAFNDEKLQEFRRIQSKAMTNRDAKERTISIIRDIENSLKKDFSKRELLSVDELEMQLKEIEENFIPYEQTEEFLSLEREINEIQNSYSDKDISQLNRKKQDLMIELEQLNKIMWQKDKSESIKNEILELKKKIATIGIERVKQEGIISLCDEWLSERNNIISNRINDSLKIAKIQMFDTLKNGEKIDTCLITDKDGVVFSTINHSLTIRVNIELQKMFCEKANIKLPIFVDESSIFDSFTLPKEEYIQMIYLFASDSEKLCIK